MTRKTCEQCGVCFVALRRDGKYCNGTCRKAAHDRRHKETAAKCPSCGLYWSVIPAKIDAQACERCTKCKATFRVSAALAAAARARPTPS